MTKAPRCSDIEVALVSPSGTRIVIAPTTVENQARLTHFSNTMLLAVGFWGEKADGRWTLQLINKRTGVRDAEFNSITVCFVTFCCC